jgi:phage-related minor tail protein
MGGIIGAQGEVDKAQAALDGLLKQQQALNQAQAASKALDMPTAIAEATQGLRDQTLQLQNQNQALQLRTRLEIEGVKPEIIEGELAKLELSQRAIEFENGLKAAVEAKNITQEDANQLLNAYKDAVNGAAEAVDQLTQAQLAAADPINRLISQWGKELADVRGQFAQLAGTIRSEFASAMSGAVTGAITGTQSVSQAFGQMFANIGRAFIDMATQMLAQQVVLSILQGIASGLAGGFRGFSGAGPYQFPSMGSYSAGFTSSMSFLASGGPMAAGRPYIVGEEGPELILPSQGGYVLNADETQQALADARGAFADNRSALNSITSTSREQQTERLLTSGASSTEIKYSRVGSGDLPFVTEADMLQAARLAAQEGARMGQQRTMAALKNNPGARRTVGL